MSKNCVYDRHDLLLSENESINLSLLAKFSALFDKLLLLDSEMVLKYWNDSTGRTLVIQPRIIR